MPTLDEDSFFFPGSQKPEFGNESNEISATGFSTEQPKIRIERPCVFRNSDAPCPTTFAHRVVKEVVAPIQAS
jgi:hypothetical protein